MEYSLTYIYITLFLNVAFLKTNCQDIFTEEYESIDWDNYENFSSEYIINFNETCIKCFLASQRCVNNTCVCGPGYFPDENDMCVKCRSHGETCTPCCAVNLKCIEGFCQYQNGNILKYVSSLALGIALILGVTAVGTVVWKLCFSSHCAENERYRRNSETSFDSVNSIQRLVDTRLRDRPPTYAEVVSVRRNEIRRILQRVEAPPPYTLFCTDRNGNIYHIYGNTAFVKDVEDVANVPAEMEPANENQENNEVGQTAPSTLQTNVAVISIPDGTSKEIIDTGGAVSCTIHL